MMQRTMRRLRYGGARMPSRRLLALLALVLVAGCGGTSQPGPARPTDPRWPAHLPTRRLGCGLPLGSCPDVASLRVRWPEDDPPPGGARAFVDRSEIAVADLELGVCVGDGAHEVGVEELLQSDTGTVSPWSGGARVDVLGGTEARIALTRGPSQGALVLTAEVAPVDLAHAVRTLGRASMPQLGLDASPEERRVFALALAPRFDEWRARLARLGAFASQSGDRMLRAAASDHEIRARAIAASISEERPSADRLAAIQRSMREEIEAASSMIVVEHECDVYSDEATDALEQVAVEVRPYRSVRAPVTRMRVAIDGVEVMDVGAGASAPLLGATTSDGLTPAGAHEVMVEATFAVGPTWPGARGGEAYVLRTFPVVVPRGGARVHTGARDLGGAPSLEALSVELRAEPVEP